MKCQMINTLSSELPSYPAEGDKVKFSRVLFPCGGKVVSSPYDKFQKNRVFSFINLW